MCHVLTGELVLLREFRRCLSPFFLLDLLRRELATATSDGGEIVRAKLSLFKSLLRKSNSSRSLEESSAKKFVSKAALCASKSTLSFAGDAFCAACLLRSRPPPVSLKDGDDNVGGSAMSISPPGRTGVSGITSLGDSSPGFSADRVGRGRRPLPFFPPPLFRERRGFFFGFFFFPLFFLPFLDPRGRGVSAVGV